MKTEYKILFEALCAFIDAQDNYCYFIAKNLNKMTNLSLDDIRYGLLYLESENHIINKSVNGFSKRYLINNPIKCRKFILDEQITKAFKIPMYEFEEGKEVDQDKLYRFKYKYKQEMYDYLESVRSEFIEGLKPFNDTYIMVKKEFGYQVDSHTTISGEKVNNVQFEKPKREIKNLGVYLFNKIKNNIKERAKQGRCQETDLSSEYLNELFEKQNHLDYYTGLEIKDLSTASVDRLDSDKCYTKDNIVITTTLINQMKWQLSVEEFINICNQVSYKFRNDT